MENTTIQFEKRRSFGGKTNNFKDKAEKNFEKAHLNAYLKGKEYFKYGFITNALGEREANFVKTKINWN